MKKIFCLLLISLLFGGCGQEDDKNSKEMPKISIDHGSVSEENSVTLQQARFGDLKNWYRDDLIKAFPAIKKSCAQIQKDLCCARITRDPFTHEQKHQPSLLPNAYLIPHPPQQSDKKHNFFNF